MYPSPEILTFSASWFDLITIISLVLTSVFGWRIFYLRPVRVSKIELFLWWTIVFGVGYIFTYLAAYLESYAYAYIQNDSAIIAPLLASKKFLGFAFYVTILGLLLLKSSTKVNRSALLADFTALIISFFIFLEPIACLLDGHGCYGKFTNAPWGMLFLHGSAPTLFPVHPTPLYLSLLHLLLFIITFFFFRKQKYVGNLIWIVLLGTSLTNIGVEFFKDRNLLLLELNFSQLGYTLIAIIAGVKCIRMKSLLMNTGSS